MTPRSNGEPRPNEGRYDVGPWGRGHAVVIGASIAGMCAARVLADHYDQVTVFGRDDLPDAAGQPVRGATGQARAPVDGARRRRNSRG